MQNNPLTQELKDMNNTEIIEGVEYILDKGFSNESVIKVLTVSPKGMFCTVTDGTQTWNVMSYRLSANNQTKQP